MVQKVVKWQANNLPKNQNPEEELKIFSPEEVSKVTNFHKSFPQYTQTPLAKLDNLAKFLGVKKLAVKDESYRFGLNAFKVLGASYSMGRFLAQRLGRDIADLPYNVMVSEEVRKELGEIKFFAATDGNHGRAVAWTANQLKQHATIYMPKGSSLTRLENIRKENAEASITDMNYDEAVRLASKHADEANGVIVQDTAWEGYTEIPTWIIQGYTTMVVEALEQYGDIPTHVFLQAGVGSMASSVLGFLKAKFGDKCPTVVIMEPDVADCFYQSAVRGEKYVVEGDMFTIMAGLACGEPNLIGYEIIKDYAKGFVSCSDSVSAYGMRILGNPLNGDDRVIAGESGAVGTGLLATIMLEDEYKALKDELGLNAESKVLLFSSEGDTDPDCYRKVVWDCKNEY